MDFWRGAEPIISVPEATLRRFWGKVIPEPGGCYIFIGAWSKNGYGAFFYEGKVEGAHEVSYLWHVGSLAPDECVLHRCDNRPCVRDYHFFKGSRGDNNTDRSLKGRSARITGLAHVGHKLTAMEVQEARRSFFSGRVTEATLARRYGVAQSTMSELVRGQSYQDQKS